MRFATILFIVQCLTHITGKNTLNWLICISAVLVQSVFILTMNSNYIFEIDSSLVSVGWWLPWKALKRHAPQILLRGCLSRSRQTESVQRDNCCEFWERLVWRIRDLYRLFETESLTLKERGTWPTTKPFNTWYSYSLTELTNLRMIRLKQFLSFL